MTIQDSCAALACVVLDIGCCIEEPCNQAVKIQLCKEEIEIKMK